MIALDVAALILPIFAPASPPGLGDLGEIGRVKSVSPACVVMRDLAIPSVNAALKGDQQMAIATPKLSALARTLAEARGQHNPPETDPFSGRPTGKSVDTSGPAAMYLGQLSQASTNMLQNTKAQRSALEAIYDDQQARAVAIWKFVNGQRNDPSNNLDVARNAPGAGLPLPTPRATSTPLDMPRLLGIPIQDENSMRAWASSLNQGIRRGEERAAQALLPILQNCLGDAPAAAPAPRGTNPARRAF